MRMTISRLKEMKTNGEKIPMMTGYDYTSARLLESVGIPIILVGDSLGQVVLGYDSTIPVTMDDILHHLKAVVRGTEKAHIVADMPFMSYQSDPKEAIRNAGSLIKEGGAQSIKVEGGQHITDTVKYIVDIGIPVMGHIGLTPQAINQLSGYSIQGKTPERAEKLISDAFALEQAGAYAIVLELVPDELAKQITSSLSIPTIGIGAGNGCDGQVQVFHDLLGLFTDFVPKHVRRYANLANIIRSGIDQYISDVQNGTL